MGVVIKTAKDIEGMRVAGRLAAAVLEMIAEHVKPGVSTGELNDLCHEFTLANGAIPAPLNYGQPPFPKSICTSINQVVCHGIPDNNKKLKKGDIVNIDVTVIKDGYFGDTSQMFYAGTPTPAAKRLVDITQESLYLAINMVKPGVRLGDIGHAIETFAHENHYSVVQEYCGHGIGLSFHEEPQVLHYGKPNTGLVLTEGMTFTIEPMLNQGTRHNKVLRDQWTVVTKDRKLSAQWEHTLAVTADGVEVLTLRENEVIPKV